MKPSEIKDLYGRLGINREDSQDEIKRAYRKLAMNYHPDRNPGNKEAEVQFKAISEAYSTLSDTHKRAEYDALSILKTVKQEPVKNNEATMTDVYRAFGNVLKEGMNCFKNYLNTANQTKKHSKKTIDSYV